MKKLLLSTALLLTACVSSDKNPYDEFNKNALQFNLEVDKHILKPTATAYDSVSSPAVQESISNLLSNMKEPYYLINHLVALEPALAINSLLRFVVNSTIGVFGLIDIAKECELEKHDTSYKETLKKLEVNSGDFVIVPLFGFMSERDVIAEPISWFIDPIGYFIGFPYMALKAVLNEVVYRTENAEFIDSTLNTKLNLYLLSKSIYEQKYGVNTNKPKDDYEEYLLDD